MKAVSKKLLSLMLVAILLVSAVPFQALAAEGTETTAAAVETTEAAVVETTAAANIDATQAAAAAASVDEDVNANTPSANAADTTLKTDGEGDALLRCIQYQLGTVEGLEVSNYQIGDHVHTKVGNKYSGIPSGDDALKILAQAIGSSAGYEFVGWYLADGTKVTSSLYITNSVATNGACVDSKEVEREVIDVYAKIAVASKSITLNLNGGTASKKTLNVKIGQSYYANDTFPTVVKNHYEFAGWTLKDGTPITEDTLVATLDAVYAQWTPVKYSVVYQAYTDANGSDDSCWTEVGFGSFSVDANSVLKTDYSNFPTSSQISDMFALEGWTISGWEYSVDGGSTFATFKAGSTKITGNTIIRPVYTKGITLHASDYGTTTKNFTVTLGKRVPSLPHPGERNGKCFVGWYVDEAHDILVSDRYNLTNTSAHPVYYPEMGDFYAKWDTRAIFKLYVYAGSKTNPTLKTVLEFYGAPAEGEFKMSDINLASLWGSSNYNPYNDSCDASYGWFDSANWDEFRLGRPADELEVVYLTTGSTDSPYYYNSEVIHNFYILLQDNGGDTSANSSAASGNTYNDNSYADPSNPSTGDEIFAAMAVMAVSAGALFLFFLNKKRAAR